ncbi:hypothetical protein [Taibaiella helva]|uniref:hypothetical protein n=1 Tax=Taibaiella helva TaxID=2301235 RepID=UPI000E5972DC|nr:hypothetical protein [Taibaiella helva]
MSLYYRKALSLLLLLVTITSSASYAAPKKKILFIGNSITYFNDMPRIFRDIANQKGDSVDLTMYAPGGTGFQHHYIDPAVFHHFREGGWEVIVLQPGSSESVGVPPTQPRALTLQQARVLIDSALHYNPCARILFYEISYGVFGSTAAQVTQYNTTMDNIRTTAGYLADSTGLSFAPAGEAFRYVWNQDPSVLLWQAPGDIHPNIKGSYMASCVFYASIFHKPSAGNTIYNGNTIADAQYYQRVADSIVLRYPGRWRIDTNWHRARFSHTADQLTVQLHNQSEGYDSLKWFLPGSAPKTTAQVNYTFNQAGTYILQLVAYFGACSDTLTQEVSLSGAGGTSIQSSGSHSLQVQLYPNPVNQMLQLQLPASLRRFNVQLRDAGGRLLQEVRNCDRLNMDGRVPGLYVIRITDQESGRQFYGKVLKR